MTASTGGPNPFPQPTNGTTSWPARAYVGGVWLVMTLGMLAYVFHYGSNVPFFDDWHLVPYITGEQPVTLEYLWSQHGDHRVPLSRLLLLGIGELCGHDFRCGMVFDVLALSATSLVLIGVSRHLRGRLGFADAFLPLLLLNPGQWETYLWCWIASLTLPICLALLVLGIMARWGVRPPTFAVLAAGFLVLAVPLTDPAGLAFVPALIVWLAIVGVVAWRSPPADATPTRFLAPAFALAAVGLIVVYYIGFKRLQAGESNPGVPATLRTTIEFLSMGVGHASVLIWPVSALIVLGLLTCAVYVLGRTWFDQPGDRSRVVALLCFFAGAACLALALGWGRAHEGPSAGFKSRYVVMALPVPSAVFIGWGCYRGRWRDRVQAGMCVLMLLLLPLNIKTAIDSAEQFRPPFAAFEDDLRDGVPPAILAEQYTNVLFPWPVDDPDKQLVHDRLLMLQRAGIGPYRDMAPDVPLREIRVADPVLPLQLDRPQTVVAARIRYAFAQEPTRTPGISVYWKKLDDADFHGAKVGVVPPVFGLPPPAEQAAIAHVNAHIDQLRVESYDDHAIKVYEIVLFVEER